VKVETQLVGTEPLLTISAFSKAVELAPSALRYYDEAGLLTPAEIGPRSGYRYYTPELERRARLIGRMREVGVPVETMRLVLDGTPEQGVELLRAFARLRTDSARRTADVVEDVAASLQGEAHTSGPVVTRVDGPELAAAVRRVSQAADDDPASRLAVVLLDITDRQVVVVSTNRSWMAQWAVPIAEHHGGERRVVVSAPKIRPFLGWLLRHEQVTISVSGDVTRVVADDETFDVATVEDRFPSYRLVTEGGDHPLGRVTINRDLLLRALGDPTAAARLVVGQDRMTVSVHGSVEGVHLDATTAGSRITVDFSPALLSSALKALVGDELTLTYSTPDRPVRLSSPDQRHFLALVMPSAPEPRPRR